MAFLYGLTFSEAEVWWARRTMLLSGSVAVGVGLSFVLDAANRANISLALFSAAAALYALNLILGLLPDDAGQPNRVVIRAARAAGVEYDSRERVDVIGDLRKRGSMAFSATHTSQIIDDAFKADTAPSLSFLPLSGIANVTTVYCNESGQYAVYNSDRYGFNNNDTVFEQVGGRILLIGDSFAHGACVQAGEDVVGRLRQHGYNAVNLGMGGHGPLLELAVLEEYGRHLKPDIVFWMYYAGNDLRDVAQNYGVPLLREYLRPGFSQNLVQRQHEVDGFWKAIIEEDERTRERPQMTEHGQTKRSFVVEARGLLTLYHLRKRIGFTSEELRKEGHGEGRRIDEVAGRAIPLLRSVLESAKRTTTSLGARLYFVYLPSVDIYCGRGGAHARSKIMALLHALNIPVVDFDISLREESDPLVLFASRSCVGSHYAAAGYERLAKLIMTEVLNDE